MTATPVRQDIFVSYAHVDNQPLPGVDNGWVTELIRCLKILLSKTLGRTENYALWMDYELRGNQNITPEILTQLESSRTLLLILSPGYLASDWCRKELETFLEKNPGGNERIFVVTTEPTDPPESLEDKKSYLFYSQSPEKKLTRFGWPVPNPEKPEFYYNVYDLAKDLADFLIVDADVHRNIDIPEETKKTVFLAEVDGALKSSYDQLSRSLTDENINVLPSRRYLPPQYESMLCEDLAKADLFIFLLDQQSISSANYYLQFIEKLDLPFIFWHSRALDTKTIKDPEHQQILRRKELIVSDMVDLQNEILKILKPPKQNGGSDEVFLFINHAPEDREYINILTEQLNQKGVAYVLPLSTEECNSVEAFHKDRENSLLSCDALLLLCFDASQVWVREQLMFCRRMALKRDNNLKGLGVCQLPGAPLGIKLPNLHQITCSDKNAMFCLDEFLQKVTA